MFVKFCKILILNSNSISKPVVNNALVLERNLLWRQSTLLLNVGLVISHSGVPLRSSSWRWITVSDRRLVPSRISMSCKSSILRSLLLSWRLNIRIDLWRLNQLNLRGIAWLLPWREGLRFVQPDEIVIESLNLLNSRSWSILRGLVQHNLALSAGRRMVLSRYHSMNFRVVLRSLLSEHHLNLMLQVLIFPLWLVIFLLEIVIIKL